MSAEIIASQKNAELKVMFGSRAILLRPHVSEPICITVVDTHYSGGFVQLVGLFFLDVVDTLYRGG